MADADIRMTSIPAEWPRPLMAEEGRFAYFERFRGTWLEGIRFRGYVYALALAGAVGFFVHPLVAGVLWAGALYFQKKYELSQFIVGSQRRVVQLI